MPHRSIAIPYGLTQEQLRITDNMDEANLTRDFLWMADEVDAGEADRIMRAAVLLHEETRHPMSECLHQAIIWERG